MSRQSDTACSRRTRPVLLALALALTPVAGNADAPAQPVPLYQHDAPAQTVQDAKPLQHFPLVEMLKPVPPGQARRDIDPLELIMGPDSRTRAMDLGPLQPLPGTADCEALYTRVTLLTDQAVNTRPGIFDDPATSLFTALGTIARPAYLLVGIAAIARLAEDRHTQTVAQQIEMLRRRMADKRCFLD